MKLFVQASEEQSMAAAPPLDDNQLFTSVLSDPEEQDTERADAGVVITGAFVSTRVTIWVATCPIGEVKVLVAIVGQLPAKVTLGTT